MARALRTPTRMGVASPSSNAGALFSSPRRHWAKAQRHLPSSNRREKAAGYL